MLCIHLQQEDSEYVPGDTEEAEFPDDWDDEEESDVLAAVLLVGPTGCGKTAMAYSAAEVGTWRAHAPDTLLPSVREGRWLWQIVAVSTVCWTQGCWHCMRCIPLLVGHGSVCQVGTLLALHGWCRAVHCLLLCPPLEDAGGALQELGFRVLELNAASERTGARLTACRTR